MLIEVCLAEGALATLGPPSSTKNIVKLCVVAEESARLGSTHVRKLVHVEWEEVGKLRRGRRGLLGNAPRLGLLGSMPQASPSRGLPRDPARRSRRGGGARCGPYDDRVSVPTEIVLRVQYIEKKYEREPPPRVAFISAHQRSLPNLHLYLMKPCVGFELPLRQKPREAELDGLPEWVGKVTNGGEGAVAGGRVVPTGKEEEAGVRLVGEEEEGGSRESCSDRRRVSRGGRRLGVRRLGLVSISSVDFFFPLTPNSSSLLHPTKARTRVTFLECHACRFTLNCYVQIVFWTYSQQHDFTSTF
ncbi:hypothetical protein BHE74_00033304 [Ensete ventricosum]|nr:hypothetical protein BHE74_00033304 [Ensete ventricosum]